MAAAEPPNELTDELKEQIQTAYRAWLRQRGFKPRRGQRDMIAEIARTLATPGSRRCVVEAGTGTGKTAAYCLAAIPIAQAFDKHVVISTATVALQEQVVLRDLPDLKRNTGLDFTFALAKGRGRYLCPKRLDDRIAYNEQREAPLFEPPDDGDVAIYRRLRSAFSKDSWDGELDSWPEGVAQRTWAPITNDRAGCGAGRCSYYHQCPFFRARRRVGEAHVVVANHDLVLSDLALGGGVVLPAPEDTIYVLDEAHHLAEKTRDHFTATVRLRTSREWLNQVVDSVDTMARRFNNPPEVDRAKRQLATAAAEVRPALLELERLARQLPFESSGGGAPIYRFPLGALPDSIVEHAQPLGEALRGTAEVLDGLREAVGEAMDGTLSWDNAEQADAWLPAIGQLAARAAAGRTLFADYAQGGSDTARWATLHSFDAADDVELASAPLDPGSILRAALWENCYGAVATSATLCALGSFHRFLQTAGLGEETRQLRVPSPFDFPRIAVFSVPKMQSSPSDAAAHTEELAALLPELLALERSALVLYTSWRQFENVVNSLSDDLLCRCRLQDTASKQALLNEHRQAIDDGEESYLFGLASFAEGVDLPGDYCRHVIIAKLPFSAPDSPVDDAIAEALRGEGRDHFREVSLPEASLRLVQACGRLIRHESDGGRITLLDRRIVTRRYGEALLSSLPPYRLEVG